MNKQLLLLFTLLFAGMALAAEVPDTASGTFKSKAISVPVKSAIAYRGHGFFDEKEEAIIVVVTNVHLSAGLIAQYYDRQRVVGKRVKDAETAIIYFEFRPDGKYHGYSYYLESGNGCGFCTGNVASTVKLANGKLTGTLKSNEKDPSFDIALDVPVITDDHGAALPADGGAPGHAYLAYHAALVKRDRAALKPLLSDDNQTTWAGAEKKGKLEGYIEYLLSEHPEKSIRITKGFATNDTATLLVEGDSRLGKWSGEVLLRKEKGTWRVDDELMTLSLQ